MFACCECGEIFHEEDAEIRVETEYIEGWRRTERYLTCPSCGSEDLEEAVQCEECGEWIAPNKIFDIEELDEKLCPDCALRYAVSHTNPHTGWGSFTIKC